MTHPAPKPGNSADWVASGTGAGITQPSNTDKTNGFAVSEKPPASWFNWFWNLSSQWFQWGTDWQLYGNKNDNNEWGFSIAGSLADALLERFVYWVAATATSPRTLIWKSKVAVAGDKGVAVYVYNPDDQGLGFEWVSNALFSSSDSKWHRRATGKDSSILRVTHDGTATWAKYLSSDSDGWNDTFVSGGWVNVVAKFGATSSSVLANTTFSNNITVQGTALIPSITATTCEFSNDILADRDIAATRNIAAGGTLNITGATTLGGTLSVTGTSTVHGVSATGNIEATGDIHADNDLKADGDCLITGNITAGSGLGFAEFSFALSGFTGAGPDKLAYGIGTLPFGAYLFRSKSGTLRQVKAWLIMNDGSAMAPLSGGKTVHLAVKLAVFDGTGAVTSTSTLATLDITDPDYANITTDATLNVAFSASGTRAIYVEATTVGGTITGCQVVCVLTIQE